jgi:hypothetical protein
MVLPIFSIDFLNDAKPTAVLEELCLYGNISVGEFSERFASPVGFWRAEDYRDQWQWVLGTLEDDHPKCLVTAMRDPRLATLIEVWPVYRVEEIVFFQHRIIFCNDIGKSADLGTIYDAIGARETRSDDGTPISEWSVPMGSIQHFLRLNAR